jgi:hypothetical protein
VRDGREVVVLDDFAALRGAGAVPDEDRAGAAWPVGTRTITFLCTTTGSGVMRRTFVRVTTIGLGGDTSMGGAATTLDAPSNAACVDHSSAICAARTPTAAPAPTTRAPLLTAAIPRRTDWCAFMSTMVGADTTRQQSRSRQGCVKRPHAGP